MYSLILLAGGKGTRMKKELPKQFLLLAGKPIIMHILERVEKVSSIGEVIIVCLEEYKGYIFDYIEKYGLRKSYILVSGGETRQQSVLNGLEASKYDNIILHESARPFVSVEDFENIINNEYLNVTYGREIPFTVLNRNENNVSGILERETLINTQLPQKFEKKGLLQAHYEAKTEGKIFTEDASLLFNYKKEPIYILEGNDYNIKLTTNFDLLIAEEIYKEYMVVK
jgi:2-C-methyl-D-erythritol 4-phosphate cytidylyltransferase